MNVVVDVVVDCVSKIELVTVATEVVVVDVSNNVVDTICT